MTAIPDDLADDLRLVLDALFDGTQSVDFVEMQAAMSRLRAALPSPPWEPPAEQVEALRAAFDEWDPGHALDGAKHVLHTLHADGWLLVREEKK